MWMEYWEAEREEREREADGADMEYYTEEYYSNHNTLGTEPNAPLAYAPGSKLHHQTMRMIGGHKGRLYI